MATHAVPVPRKLNDAKKTKAKLFAFATNENKQNSVKKSAKKDAKDSEHRDSILFGTPLRRAKRVKPAASTDCRKSRYRQAKPTPSRGAVRFTPLARPKRPAKATRSVQVAGPIGPITTPRAARPQRPRAAIPSQEAFDIEFQADPNALSEILSSESNLVEAKTPFEFRRQSSVFATPLGLSDLPVPMSAPSRRRDSIVAGEPLRVFKRRAAPSPAVTTPMHTSRRSRGTPGRQSMGKGARNAAVSHVQVAPHSLANANVVLHRLDEADEAEKFATFSHAAPTTPLRVSPLRSPVRGATASVPMATTPKKPFEAAAKTPTGDDGRALLRRLSMGIESILKDPSKQFATPKSAKKAKAAQRPAAVRTPLRANATAAPVAHSAAAREATQLEAELRKITAEENALVKEIARMETPKRSEAQSRR